ncbi:Multidrug resistance ABC transporter ATP-binding and permease protein [compost metagenome]
MTVISGPSGSGKTTLMNMMLGLQTPPLGQLRFRGNPIEEITSANILSNVAATPQLSRIFAGTLRENLSLGAEGEPDDRLLLEIVNGLGLNNLRQNEAGSILDIQLGIQGHDISGGEQQRISLGRAIARKKPILVIDEPTTGLDDSLIKEIIPYIRSQCETLIMISHDRRVIQKADNLIDLSPGASSV